MMGKIKTLIIKYVVVIALFIKSLFASAFSLQPILPFVQVSENGLVKCKSVPFVPFDADPSLGQTFVYSSNKLLYVIDKYFYNPFLTTDGGKYLVEFNFRIYYRSTAIYINKDGSSTQETPDRDGKAINIYKDGKLFKSILFSELKIDSSKIDFTRSGNWFDWDFSVSDSNRNEIRAKMERVPFFTDHGNLFVIAADEQLIEIDLSTGKVVYKALAYEALLKLNNWSSGLKYRKYEKVKYPGKFYLPKLHNGKSIDQSLAKYLNKTVAKDDKEDAVYQVYIHTLLINKKGRCEDVYVSTEMRKDLSKQFTHNSDNSLKSMIEDWIKDQAFNTRSFPKGIFKYKYTGFLYFK
jgi:hypothetical protein